VAADEDSTARRRSPKASSDVCGLADPSIGPGGHDPHCQYKLSGCRGSHICSSHEFCREEWQSVGLMLPTEMSSRLLRLSSNPSCAPLTQTGFKAAAMAGAGRREVLDGVPRPRAAGQQQTGADQGGRPPTAGSDLQTTLSAWRSIQAPVVCTTDSTPPGIMGTPEEGPRISLDQSHQTLADEPAMGRSPPFGLRTATNLAQPEKVKHLDRHHHLPGGW
jgi:hypothetical protein